MPNLITSADIDAFMAAANNAAARTVLGVATTAQGTKADNVAATTPYGAPVAITFANPLSPAVGDGLFRKVTMTGDMEINPPSGGSEGQKWQIRCLASGATRTLTLDAAIVIPSEFAFTSQAIASGETWVLQLYYNGTAWELQTLIGGY